MTPSGWRESGTPKRGLPPGWNALRLKILARDGRACVAIDEGTGGRCGRAANDVDHIEPGGNHHPSNLQSLCAWHHRRKTAREAAAARAIVTAVTRSKATRPPERHPGAYLDGDSA